MDDLISRQEAFYAVNKAFDRETLLTGLVRSIAVRAIRDVPSAEPERKTGQWIVDEAKSANHIEKIYICSSCKNFEAWGETELYNYCPDCGSYNGGEQE